MANSDIVTADQPFLGCLTGCFWGGEELGGREGAWGWNFTRLIITILLKKKRTKKKSQKNPTNPTQKNLKKPFHMLWHTVRSINGNSSAVTIKANILNLQTEKTEELTNPILLGGYGG